MTQRQNPDLFRVLSPEEWAARMADTEERKRFEEQLRAAMREGYEAISGPMYATMPGYFL